MTDIGIILELSKLSIILSDAMKICNDNVIKSYTTPNLYKSSHANYTGAQLLCFKWLDNLELATLNPKKHFKIIHISMELYQKILGYIKRILEEDPLNQVLKEYYEQLISGGQKISKNLNTVITNDAKE